MYKKVKFLKKCSFKVWPLAKIKTWHLFHRVGGRGTSGYIELDIPTSRSMSGSTEPDILTKKCRSEFCYNSWFHYIEFRGKKFYLVCRVQLNPTCFFQQVCRVQLTPTYPFHLLREKGVRWWYRNPTYLMKEVCRLRLNPTYLIKRFFFPKFYIYYIEISSKSNIFYH